MVNRTMERTRADVFRRQMNPNVPQVGENQITPLPFERFH